MDRYTKVVLTVIAVCLVWLSFGGPSLIARVDAQMGDQRVVITGWADQNGVIRPLPAGYGGVASPEPGKPVAPSALPIWVLNR